MSRERLRVLHRNGTISEFMIEVSDDEPWWIDRLLSEGAVRRLEGVDLFEALNALRLEYEGRGDQILCAGARRDVRPSSMSRSMSGGRMAYILRMGRHSDVKDLVDIFDEADPTQVTTVVEQQEAFEVWYQSVIAG